MNELKQVEQARVHSLIEQDWQRVLDLMPLDLEASARAEKALQRRRKVQSAVDLLRMVLSYALGDLSLRLTGAWATITDVAHVSDVAVLKRLRKCRSWLASLIGALLRRRVQLTQRAVRLRLVDATVVSRPGSKGTDWRAHLSLNLEQSCLDGIEITDAHGGETFARYAAQPSDILVGDRIYAHARSLGSALAAHAQVVARIGWQNLPLEADGERLDVIQWLKSLSGALGEQAVRLDTPQGHFALRLVACRLPQEAADRTRQRLIRVARKKGKTVDKRTLFAAGFVMLVTNLSTEPWNAKQVTELYRIRWQVEVLIKRFKSVMHLDHLRAQDPELAQVYLLGKMLGALIVDELSGQVAMRHPTWFQAVERPISPWRLLAVLYDGLRNSVRGDITLGRILAVLPDLERYLRDGPRKRRQQCAVGRNLLRSLGAAQAP
jgi:hypothetical protein